MTPHLIENDFTFEGTVEINATVKDITNKIVLHAYNITHKQVDVFANDVQMKVLSVNHSQNFSEWNSYNFLIISLGDDLLEGTHVTIKINYTGFLGNDMKGFYRSSYKDDKGVTQYVICSLF